MANVKQYSDLQQASVLNDTDKFAVAQEGSPELKTVDALQVAQKAAALVSTDQLAEFVTDVGLGKQVLAQTLNDKGAGVLAFDTLAQMAAKAAALDVVGAKEYIKCPVFGIRMNTSAKTSFAAQAGTQLPYTIVLEEGKISMMKVAEDGVPYAAAVYQNADLFVSNAYCILTTSQNGKYIMAWVRGTSGTSSPTGSKVFFLEANYTSNTLTLLKSYTLSFYFYSGYLLYVANDGKHACGIHKNNSATADKTVFFDLESDTPTVLPSITTLSGMDIGNTAIVYDSPIGLIVCPDRYYGSYEAKDSPDMYTMSIDFSTYTAAVLNSYRFVEGSHRISWPCFLYDSNILFITAPTSWSINNKDDTGNINGTFMDYELFAFDLTTRTVTDSIQVRTIHRPRAGGAIQYMNNIYDPKPLAFTGTDNKVSVTVGYTTGIQYDLTTKKFLKPAATKVSGAYVTAMVTTSAVTSSVSAGYDVRAVLCDEKGNPKILYITNEYYNTAYGAGVLCDYIQEVIQTYGPLCIGQVYKRNGCELPCYVRNFDPELYEAGAYDVENSSAVVELDAEEAA